MQETIIGFLVGVLSNLATHYLLKHIEPIEGTRAKGGTVLKSWLETIIWGILPLAFPLSALVLIQARWPLTVFGKSAVVAGSFLLATGVVAAIRYISIHRSTKHILTTLLIAGLFAGLAGFSLLDQMLPTFIAMDCPGKVTGTTTLQGRIIDPRWRVYIILRPRQGGAFVNEVPPAGKDGTWYATCAFGGGPKTVFEIAALALSPDSVSVLDHSVNQKSEEYQQRLVALASYRTSICVVTKE